MSGDTSLGAAPWPNYALPHGTIVNGYRIERVLGSGGFGVTYLARDLLQQPFAIKEYYPRQFAIRQELKVLAASAEDEALFGECRERFLREAQALVLLTRVAGAGDGIVRVQTYFEAHGTCFLVMDYIEGASLASVLQKASGGLEAARVRTLLTQLLSAIGVVHRAGLMHRDIKPANIILRDDDRVVLIDFGSSREATGGQTTAYTQIYSGGYAPPEQMLGMRQGAFSDIYAIGAVCYRAIGGTVADALARQIALAGGRADPQPSAAEVGAGRYPAALLAAIDAALAVDATQRPQNVDAMLGVLGRDEPVADATVVAPRRSVARGPVARGPVASGPATAPVQSAMQRWRGVWGVAGGVAALVVIGVAYWVVWRPAVPPPADRQQVAASSPAPAPSPPGATPQGQGRTPQ
ncbi:MAG TPA: serine/threonine-protein kinase, partial [Acetobacteraceae bacterium]|nr:serine/threonine-protein kinase [Acetobacteraceae bacterium]